LGQRVGQGPTDYRHPLASFFQPLGQGLPPGRSGVGLGFVHLGQFAPEGPVFGLGLLQGFSKLFRFPIKITCVIFRRNGRFLPNLSGSKGLARGNLTTQKHH
jgi:hypothetical protein